jgi:hypothetical protein
MAQIEPRVRTVSHVSLISREAADELDLEPGVLVRWPASRPARLG